MELGLIPLIFLLAFPQAHGGNRVRRMYESINIDLKNPNSTIIDLRTDTVTKIRPEMKKAMMDASLGFDDIGADEDPITSELERLAAKLLGKEAALFLVSTTMANLIAGLVHCPGRGEKIISGDKNHIILYEHSNLAMLGGLSYNTISQEPDGTLPLIKIRDGIRHHWSQPRTCMIVTENAQNHFGGLILPQTWLDEVAQIGAEYGIPIHMDGARLFHASVASGIPPDRIVKGTSSISLSLTKIGSPIGGLLVGDKKFIQAAKKIRDALGGAMNEPQILAAAGIYSLQNLIEGQAEVHQKAKILAKAILDYNSPAMTVNLTSVQTNMILLKLDAKIEATQMVQRFMQVPQEEVAELKKYIRVLSWFRDRNNIRLVLNMDLSSEGLQLVIEKLKYVAQEFTTKFNLLASAPKR